MIGHGVQRQGEIAGVHGGPQSRPWLDRRRQASATASRARITSTRSTPASAIAHDRLWAARGSLNSSRTLARPRRRKRRRPWLPLMLECTVPAPRALKPTRRDCNPLDADSHAPPPRASFATASAGEGKQTAFDTTQQRRFAGCDLCQCRSRKGRGSTSHAVCCCVGGRQASSRFSMALTPQSINTTKPVSTNMPANTPVTSNTPSACWIR